MRIDCARMSSAGSLARTYRADLDLVFANPDGTPLMPNSISATVSRVCRSL